MQYIGRFTAIVMATVLASGPVHAMSEDVRCVQQNLIDLGYNPGPADGLMGQRTASAARGVATDLTSAGAWPEELTAANAADWCALTGEVLSSPAYSILRAPVAQLLPADVLVDFAGTPAEERAELCMSLASVATLEAIEPVTRIAGFTSRMGAQIAEVPGAREAEQFAGRFAELSGYAFAADDDELKGELLGVLAGWARAGAFLDTISCVRPDGSLITSGQCTEWTVPDGSDLSGMKDATFATFLAAGLIRSYFIALSDFQTAEREEDHEAILAWTRKIGERLKRPTSVYFGLNMGWYWPGILNNIAAGNLSAARGQVEALVAGIQRLVRADGSIEDRTTRGDRAIWYHYTSLGEIVLSLEFARAAGVAIPAQLEERLHAAVGLFLDAVEDPMTIDRWASQAHNADYRGPGIQDWNFNSWPNGTFGGTWLHIYPYRYPDRPEARRLRDLVPVNAASARQDIDFGFGLGCMYNAAAIARE